MADAPAARLRAVGHLGRTGTVTVRFTDFRALPRSTTLAAPTDSAHAIHQEARRLLDGVDPTPGVRLLGVSVGTLTTGGRQLSFDDADAAWVAADETVDEIRDRYGSGSIVPATLLDVETAPEADGGSGSSGWSTRPEQPWGPAAPGD